MRVFVVGSLAFDRIMDFPGRFRDHILPEKIHVLSVSFEVKSLRENRGGTAGNIAYGLSLLGVPSTILSQAGSDFGEYKKFLEKQNIQTEYVREVADERTASAYIFTDRDDNQITGFHSGAMGNAEAHDLSKIMKKGEDAWGIISAGNAEEMITYAKAFHEHDIPYIFDPAQQIPVLSKDDLCVGIEHARVLISNDYEYKLILDKSGLDASTILSTTDMIITTKGEKGSVIRTRDGEEAIPIVNPERIVDPTGAGDSYRSGILKGIIDGLSLQQMGKLGATIASYPIEHHGTQEHMPTREDITKRYQQTFNETINIT